MKGKLIVIEGTDCSGKETQSNKLLERLKKSNINVQKFSFPNYDSPTGKIIGGPYLGKQYICEGWFKEKASNVNPKVASLYYAADRKYNIDQITNLLNNGVNIILDRYTYSNMAHQGGKIKNKTEREEMYNFIEKLEFDLLNLPEADIKIFLHMPYEWTVKLKENRNEDIDEHEQSESHLRNAENAYMEISQKYHFHKIECANTSLKTVDEINNEIYDYVIKNI